METLDELVYQKRRERARARLHNPITATQIIEEMMFTYVIPPPIPGLVPPPPPPPPPPQSQPQPQPQPNNPPNNANNPTVPRRREGLNGTAADIRTDLTRHFDASEKKQDRKQDLKQDQSEGRAAALGRVRRNERRPDRNAPDIAMDTEVPDASVPRERRSASAAPRVRGPEGMYNASSRKHSEAARAEHSRETFVTPKSSADRKADVNTRIRADRSGVVRKGRGGEAGSSTDI
jgi:hypothetical protein